MKNNKKLISLFLAFIMTISIGSLAYAAQTNAKLLNIYADGMLFLQNSTAVISGNATPGNTISLVLEDKSNKTVTHSETSVLTDGTFSVSFEAPTGSFDEYTITLKENGNVFEILENVVFGELWLASGQSNMQYPLSQSRTGKEMFENSRTLSKWLRVLLVPSYPEYNGSTSAVPALAQKDISDAIWVNGENTAVYNMSAVAYFFAQSLMEKLDMPVGILNSSLGGSSIRSWLSREAIDNSPEIKSYLEDNGEYIELANWNEAQQSVYFDMTANFNQKIAPLKDFRISGMIWYQGETDLMLGNTKYAESLDLLQKSYTQFFNYENGLLPLIFTQIASYNYSEDSELLNNWNYEYTKIQQSQPTSRALITIYDVPLTYLPEAGLIHPERKEEVGYRMAHAADGLVYNKNNAYTAATVKSTLFRDNAIYITFDNVGDGLMINGEKAKGFAVCSDNGIYVPANAEIITSDTIKVYADDINEPTSATYAFCTANQTANLYTIFNNATALPVAPFITDCSYTEKIWTDKTWTECDDEYTWHTQDDTYSGYYNTWESCNAELSFSETDSHDNTRGLNVTSEKYFFNISPVLMYKNNLSNTPFTDCDADYSAYSSVSFYVRNNGTKDVTFEGLRLYKNAVTWYCPEVDSTLDINTTIPADGQWHKITLDLNKLYLLGNECTLSYSSEKLTDITQMKFMFSSAVNSTADISIDSFTFVPAGENINTSYEVSIKNADSFIELLSAIVLTIVGKFALLF